MKITTYRAALAAFSLFLLAACSGSGGSESDSGASEPTIDTEAPTISVVLLAGDGVINSYDNLSAITLSGSTSGVEDGQIITFDIGGVGKTASVTGNSFDTTVDLSRLADGTSIRLTADVADAAGNAASQFVGSLVKDVLAPEIDSVSVESGAHMVGSTVAITITASDNEAGLSLSSRLFNGRALAEVSDNNDGTYSASYTVEAGDADVDDGGDVAVELAFTDGVANVGTAIISISLAAGTSIDTSTPSIKSITISADDVINSSDTLSAVAVSVATTGVGDGQVVSLNIGGITADVAITSNAFDGTVDLSELADGTEIVVSGDVSDVAGNAAATFTKDSFVIKDTVAPSIVSVSVSADDVINSSDTLSAVAVLVSTTGVEDGQKVYLSVGGITADVVITSNVFDGTVDLSDLSDGSEISVSGDVSDLAGNTAATLTKSIVKDTAAPTIAVTSVAVDGIINALEQNSVVINGSTSGAANDQTVSLALSDGTNTLEATTAVSNDNYSATVDLTSLNDSISIVLGVAVSDAAGNEASASKTDIVKDTLAPSIVSISVAGDNLVNISEKSDSVAVAGSTSGVEDDQQITLTINGANITTAVSGNSFSTSADLSGLGDGTYTVGGNVADAAGNPADAANVDFVIDTTPPSQKVDSASISLSTDNGSSASDFITNEAEQAISAELDADLGADDVLYASVNGGSTWQQVDSANIDGTSIAWPTTLLEGTSSIQFQVADAADNNGTIVKKDYTLDTTAPTQSVSGIDLSVDSGAVGDLVTNTASQTITATLSTELETGDLLFGAVSLDENSAPAWINITDRVTDQAISWDATLSAGENDIQFIVEDAAGNSGEPAKQSYFFDNEAPQTNTAGTTASAAEASVANLDASNSTDNYGIASYEWTQVQSDGSALSADDIKLSIANANDATTTAITPGITDDDIDSLSFYFSLKITDVAGNSSGAMSTLNVSNTYTTPDITASIGTAPNFDQLSLSWPTTTGLTYDLHRSSDSGCDLSATNNCADYELYAALDLSDGAQTDSGLDFFSSYYYWLVAELNGEVVSLSSAPLEANTTGPALNDTGITSGGDYPSGFDSHNGSSTVCDGGYLDSDNANAFVAFTAEDCELGRDADDTLNNDSDGNAGFSFTRLNSDGSEYSGSGDYGTDPWACVLDNVTGLIWEVKTNDNTLRDRDEGFTWHDPDNETFTGTESNQDTDDFIAYINTSAEVNSGSGLCGRTDWRLPTVQEIHGLADYAATSTPFIDTGYFPNTQNNLAYWAADLNVNPNLSDYAWAYDPFHDQVFTRSTTQQFTYARLVSSSEAVKSNFSDYSNNRYTDHGDGTISDTKTGLMWMQCTYGQNYDSAASSICGATTAAIDGDWRDSFTNAVLANAASSFGYTDWRLPNIKELGSLVDFSKYEPAAINTAIFAIPSNDPNDTNLYYWSSTPTNNKDDQELLTQALVIGFGTNQGGRYAGSARQTSLTGYLRLVRDDANTPRILTVNINGDNIINAGDSSNLDAIQVSGSTADVEAGKILSLAINTNAYSTSAEIKEDGSFTATIDLSGIADGTYSVTADVSDSAGEEANQFTSTLLVDTAAPTIASVSATSGTYGIGASVPLSITATDAETGLTLTSKSFNGQSLGVVTDNQDGTYTTSYTVVENDADIADGGSVITDLAFTDLAGNLGTATTSVILSGASIDAHRPTIASVSVEAGTHGIGDSVAITITAGANESGLTLTSATFNGATLGEVTDNGGGTYTATYLVEEDNAHVADGDNVEVNLAFTDPAGNVGTPTTSINLTGASIDTTPPTQNISDIDISDDSGVSDTDFLTNKPTQTITATLSDALGNGDSLHGSVDSGSTWNEIAASVSGTAITWNSVTLSSGAIQFKVVDAAGNDGDVSEQAYILDTTAPTIDTTGTDSTVDEGSSANLNASGSDSNGIASYAWQQVSSDGSAFSGTVLSIDDSTAASTAVSTPGIADDSGANLSLYFAVTITDKAANIATSSPLTLTVTNTYTTPAITASIGTAPNFDQLSLSWPTATGLTYDLYRSSAADCDLSDYTNCAHYALYDGVDLSSGAQIDSGLDFFSSYYYWLEAKYDGTVVSLSSTPFEANTTGPALNDTGVTQGGDYPSGFDSLGDGTACNGGYLVDDNGDVIADPDNHSGNSTFIPFDNEDCELGRDADATLNDDSDGNAGFNFTRLNSDGSEYTGSGDYGTDPWSCVLDNVTGLIWEVKTNDNTLRDRDEGFTWYDSGTADGTPSDQDTGDFVDYVNGNAEVNSGNGLCGQTNWRLPTVQELVGISDFSTYEPVVDTSYFPNSRTGAYEWSWTADLNSDTENLPNFAWLYNYYIGSIRSGGNSLGATSNSFYVRLVSSSEAVKSYFNDYSSDGGRYTDHEDGTVSDNRTGLMWMKCIYGQAHNLSDNSCGGTGAGAGGTWQEAFAKAAAINEGVGTFGYTDWRLPNMKELLSLVDLSSFQPPINQAIFPNTDGQSQWTSTLSAQDGGDAALAVGLGADPEFGLLGKTTTTTRVRLVRDDVNTPRILTLDINGDNVINAGDDLVKIPVSGSTSDIEDGQQLTLVVGSKTFYIDVSADGFEDTIDLSDLADGTYPVTADVSDNAGKEANQFTSTLLKDTEPPSITLVVVATDNIINSTEASAATITGTTEGVEDGQIISIAINDNADPVVKITATATVTSNAFNITNLNLSSLTDGTSLSLTADVADAAGNPAPTFTESIVKDVVAPTITIDSVAEDGIINASEQSSVVINGSTSGAADDQTVSLVLSDGTNTLEATTAVSNDSYSATVDLTSFAESSSISFGVTVSDAAGNEGSASKTDIVKDITDPSIVSISVTDDNVVNSSEKSNSVAVSGTTDGVEDNQVITLAINGTNITTTVTDNNFATSADLSTTADGTYPITANVADAAGNLANQATSNFEIDTTPPEQAVILDTIKLSTDSGSSPSDLITKQAAQSISATLSASLDAGDVLYASVNGGATWQQVDSANINGTSIAWPATLLEGTSSIQFQVADAADNNGTIVKKDYTLDTTAPTQSISTIKLSDDSGSLNDDFLTNNPTQTISASLSAGLESGDTLHGSVDSGVSWEDITYTSVSGTSINWATTLSTGAIQFKVVDAAGNDGDVAGQAYILDTTAPTIDTTGTDSAVDEASSANLNASGSDSSGIASYAWAQVESDGSTLTGTALTIDDATAASTSVSTPGIADDGIADQSLYFAVTVTDAAGNPATSSPLTLTITNTYKTPEITTSIGAAPEFYQSELNWGELSFSWAATTDLTYSLYRSTDLGCVNDLESITNIDSSCANGAIYTEGGAEPAISISSDTASIADTGLEFFTNYYYWLEAKLSSGEVVSLSPEQAATTSGPVLNDTGITGGGDYPSGFDNHNGLADGVEGAVCNGGYFTDQGAVVSDLSSYSDTSALTFNPFTNEDCELGRDADTTLNADSDGNAAFVFIKLDISGNVLEASATDWSCVLDHTTGLIWEVKTTDGTWRDVSKGFTWYNPNHGQDYDKDGNTITFDGTESSQDTQDFITYLNSDSSVNNGSGLCGRSNWRLPTVHEIQGLADYDVIPTLRYDDVGTLIAYEPPAIDTNYFPYALTSPYQWYWTSHLNVDPDVNTAGGSSTSNYFAWTYGSAIGNTRSGTGAVVGTTDRSNYVRLVSSSTAVASHFSDYSNDRYTDNGDGTISDHQTGLMWSKCSYGQTYDANDANSDGIICEGSPAFGTWQQAFAWAADSTDHGHSDWRLPNIKELGSIVDFGSAKPAINQSIFPNTVSGPYWSSTPSRANVHQTIFIGFQAGDYGPSDRISNLYLRLVRDLD